MYEHNSIYYSKHYSNSPEIILRNSGSMLERPNSVHSSCNDSRTKNDLRRIWKVAKHKRHQGRISNSLRKGESLRRPEHENGRSERVRRSHLECRVSREYSLPLRRVLVDLLSLVFPFPPALFFFASISPLSISFPGNSH